MIRTGQMMIGRCLINIKTNSDNEILEDDIKNILAKFFDNKESVYSIHNISTVGSFLGVNIGSWFGPTITSLSLQLINSEEDNSNLHINVFQDGIVEKEILSENVKKYENNLILLPIMLGLKIFLKNMQMFY